jgi:hypothetical protein
LEAFFSSTVKAILLGLIAIVFLLNRLARARPDIGWLQVFRLPVVQMSEEERERRRRSANRMGALELILAGFALPAVYFISTIMFFSEPSTIPVIIVSACAVFCIGVGIWILARNV